MLRGNPAHSGFSPEPLHFPLHLTWVREISGERLGSAMEPIVAQGRVFIATHAGRIYSLDAETGEGAWAFEAHGPFLQSPAVADGVVIAGSTDGELYGLDASTGVLKWKTTGGDGGFAAAPVCANEKVFIGTRSGDFFSVLIKDGTIAWRTSIAAPVRQTAAVVGDRVIVLAEDLKLRTFDVTNGNVIWTSKVLPGQTARDYYPVVLTNQGQPVVVVRTNPILNMGQRIERDRFMLCEAAGVDDSSWQKLDTWLKSENSHGRPELWAAEQLAIRQYLESNPDARSFFTFDVGTGQAAPTAPVLWVGGCQGVGLPPAVTPDGRLLLIYRSVYGNWNLGVAPLVTLGFMDLARNQLEPLFHRSGVQPAWNTFWGTSDESQSLLIADGTALIIHQGTLSGFNLGSGELFAIAGERDTFGSFPNPSWARNEWHGPARAGAAISNGRVFWQTGSRLLCMSTNAPSRNTVRPIAIGSVPTHTQAPPIAPPTGDEIRRKLARAVDEALSENWAPLFSAPGLAGREFEFAHSADLFAALAWAYPHLPPELQENVRARLRREWVEFSPLKNDGAYRLTEGARREWFRVPPGLCTPLGRERQPHAFAGVYAIWWMSQRCEDSSFTRKGWDAIKGLVKNFLQSGWSLDPAVGDLFANRYLASLMAFNSMAEAMGDNDITAEVASKITATSDALVQWWTRVSTNAPLGTFRNSSELDRFITRGDGLFFAVSPHRHKLALFADLTPEIAAMLKRRAPEAVEITWNNFARLCPTWNLAGEERQVHFGENFVDTPDFNVNAFRAFAWLKGAEWNELKFAVDVPFCRADLAYITKLSIALESE